MGVEAGNTPNTRCPKFQTMADISNEKTIAKPAAEPTFMTNSTGSRLRIPKATAPVEVNTPIKFHAPYHTTAIHGGRLWV